MKTKNATVTCFIVITISCLLSSPGHAQQQQAKPAHMPVSITWRNTSVSSVDNLLMKFSELYNILSAIDKATSDIQLQLSDTTASIDFDALMNEVNSCMIKSTDAASEAPELIGAVTDLASNLKSIPVLKIPSVLKNLNAARIVMQQCIAYAKYTTTYTLPEIVKTINLKKAKTV